MAHSGCDFCEAVIHHADFDLSFDMFFTFLDVAVVFFFFGVDGVEWDVEDVFEVCDDDVHSGGDGWFDVW